MTTAVLDAKYARLLEVLRGLERVVVAFSGGVDSTFLARAARDALGDQPRRADDALPPGRLNDFRERGNP